MEVTPNLLMYKHEEQMNAHSFTFSNMMVKQST